MKIKKFIKKVFNANFIGIQISRFRNALVYLTVLTSLLSTASLIKLALPALEFESAVFIFIVPIVIITYTIGYFLDKKNIITNDALKTNELGQRRINTSDKKLQEFHLIRTKAELKLMQDPKFDAEKYIDEEYQKYIERWS